MSQIGSSDLGSMGRITGVFQSNVDARGASEMAHRSASSPLGVQCRLLCREGSSLHNSLSPRTAVYRCSRVAFSSPECGLVCPRRDGCPCYRLYDPGSRRDLNKDRILTT